MAVTMQRDFDESLLVRGQKAGTVVVVKFLSTERRIAKRDHCKRRMCSDVLERGDDALLDTAVTDGRSVIEAKRDADHAPLRLKF